MGAIVVMTRCQISTLKLLILSVKKDNLSSRVDSGQNLIPKSFGYLTYYMYYLKEVSKEDKDKNFK